MSIFSKHNETALKNTLVGTRSMTSLIEKEMSLATGAIKRETVNWVPMWVDWENSIRSDRSSTTAVRAITDKGELLWYVRHDVKKHGYHSTEAYPFDAIKEAMAAWDLRKKVRAEWPEIIDVRNELLNGRRKLRITMKDAEDSALCTLGIQWFSKRFGISRKASISGRTAALLMKVEPQMGFVIYQALRREAPRQPAETSLYETANAINP